MKSTAFYLFILLLIVSFTTQAKCSKTIRWFSNNLEQIHSPSELKLSSDLVLLRNAIENIGCQITFVKMPWARSLVEIEQGRIDIMGGAFKTNERQEFAWYSDFAFDVSLVLFMRTADVGKYELNSLTDLLKYQLHIGTQIDAIYSDEFSELLKDPNFARLVHANTSSEALWNMLKIGRIDVFIAELAASLEELKSLGLNTQISPSDFVVSTQNTHFIYSKKTVDIDFVRAVDRELQKLTELDKAEPIKKTPE